MTITKEGALASFYTVNKAPIKHLKVYFSPKQTGEGDPSPENVKEISGWDSLRLFFTGKNLLNPNLACQYVNQKTNVQYGIADWRTPSILDGSLILTPGTYIYGVTNDVDRVLQWTVQDESGVKLDNAYSGHRSRVFTVTNTSKMRIHVYANHAIDPSWIYLYKDSTTTDYEKNKSNNQTITLPSTLYGGYLDLITGELVQQYDMYSAPWKDWSSSTDLGNNTRKAKTIPYIPVGGNASTTSLCNLTNNYLWSNSDDSIHFYVANSSNTVYAILPNSLDENQEVQISYKLKNPITYQLTPTQLQTFIGQNNIWSNADRVEVEYDLAESNDELYRRRNIILQSAPHLETVSGNIANFSTDVIAPIKEAKIYFNPVQEGSGDPSPENVREITGWTGCKIVQAPENIIQSFESTSKATLSNITTYGFTMTSTVSSYNTSIPGSWENGYIRINIDKTNVNGYIHMYAKVKQLTNPLNVNYVRVAPHGTNSLGTDLTISNGIIDATFSFPSGNTSYLEFKNCGATIEVSDLIFTISSNDIASSITFNDTIYGGYIDLVKGELIQEWRKVFLKDLSWANYSSKIHYYANLRLNNTTYAREYNSFIYSDTLTSHNLGFTSEEVGEFTYYTLVNSSATQAQNYKNNIWTKLPEAMEREEANNWIKTTYSNASIVYKLESPIHYQLTPQQLTALKGVNNIWSDANGPVEIQYWAH